MRSESYAGLFRTPDLLENLYTLYSHINSLLTSGHRFVRVLTLVGFQGERSLFMIDSTGLFITHTHIPVNQNRKLKLGAVVHSQKTRRECSLQAAA